MGVRVLLIEDDETIAEPLADGLRHFGLTVHHVATGADGLRGPHGDVVLLDLGLPDMDGIDVCRGIRRTSDVPIIILSARGEEADRVLGLELGADDYLAKPFSIRELVARIRAVSRRHLRPGGGVAAGVVAGVVVAEEGVERGVGGGFGMRAGVGDDFGARAGIGGGAGVGFGASADAGVGVGIGAGSEAYAQRDAPAEELVHQWDSATGEGGAGPGGRSGRGLGAGFGTDFGAESDFSAASDFGAGNAHRTGNAHGAGNARGAGDDFAVASDFAAESSSRVGDEGAGAGDGRARRTGFDAGAGGSAYDWSASYETPAPPPGAPGTRAPETQAHGTPAASGNQTYGNPLFGTAQGTPGAPGTPPQGSPMYGTPAHGTPTYGTPPHGSPAAYDPPPYEPPVYEPPMYEQAPPGPRDSSGPGAADDDGSAPPPPGPLVVDRRTRQVWVGEVPVALTPKEFELLALLTEDPGAVYSRQQILNRVWDDHYQGPTKTLDVHVATLRRKLGDPAWIQTLRGVGFRLAVRSPGQSPGQTNGPGQSQGRGRGRGPGSGRHRTSEARAS